MPTSHQIHVLFIYRSGLCFSFFTQFPFNRNFKLKPLCCCFQQLDQRTAVSRLHLDLIWSLPMPGITAPLRGPSSGGSASSSLSFASRVILLLTVLPLALAFFAFVLQWRGGLNDPASAWPSDTQKFPGMENSPIGSSSAFVSSSSSSSSSDCAEILSRSSSPSFPFYHGWKFDFDSDPRPKVVS